MREIEEIEALAPWNRTEEEKQALAKHKEVTVSNWINANGLPGFAENRGEWISITATPENEGEADKLFRALVNAGVDRTIDRSAIEELRVIEHETLGIGSKM